jgi:centrin-3
MNRSQKKKDAEADNLLQDALVSEFSSAKSVRLDLNKRCRRLDTKSKKIISKEDFEEELLEPYNLSSTTLSNLSKRFKRSSSSSSIEYPLFIDHAVSLYIKGADDDVDSLDEEDLDEEDVGTSNSSSRKKKSGRKLTPTVDEDLLTELEANFSTQKVLVSSMMEAKEEITVDDLLSSMQFKKFLSECSIQLKPTQIREIFKAFCGSDTKKLDFLEFLEYCQVLHPGKRPSNRRRSMRGSEIDQEADVLRELIKKHNDPDLIFDKFKRYDDLDFISGDQFYTYIKSIFKEKNFTRTEVKRLMDRFDKDDDGMISRKEFHQFLKKNSRRNNNNSDDDVDSDDRNSDYDSENEENDPNPGSALNSDLRDALLEAYSEDGDLFDTLFKNQDRKDTGIVTSSKFKTILTKLFKETSLESRKKSEVSAIIKAYGGSTSSFSREKDIKYKSFLQFCRGKKNGRKKGRSSNSNRKRTNDTSEEEEVKDKPNPGASISKDIRKKLAIAYKRDKRSFDTMFRKLDKSGIGKVKSAKFKDALIAVLKDIGYKKISKSEVSVISRAYKYGKEKNIDYDLFLKLCRGDYTKLPKLREKGDAVEVKLKSWRYYFKGIIKSVNSDGTYDIYFEEDNQKEKNVKEEYIKGSLPVSSSSASDGDDSDDVDQRSSRKTRRRGGAGKDDDDDDVGSRRTTRSKEKKKMRKGDKVEVKLSSWAKYFKGEIERVRSDGTYDVYFPADNTTETGVSVSEIKGGNDDDFEDDVKSSRGREKRKRKKGDKVEVKLSSWSKYFRGEIERVRSNGTYDVFFPADNTTEKGVSESEIKSNDSDDDDFNDDVRSSRTKKRGGGRKKEGDEVQVKLSNWNKYFKGEIKRVRSDGTYDVYFPADRTTEKRVKEIEIKSEEDDEDDDRSSRNRRNGNKKRSLETLRTLRRFYSRAVKKGRARDYRDIFQTMDSNRDGAIDSREFYRAMKDIGFDIDRNEVNDLIDDYDLNNNGRIEWREFLRLCALNDDDDDDRERNTRSSRDSRNALDRDDLNAAADALAEMFQKSVRRGEARDLEDIFQALDANDVGSISTRAFERVIEKDLQLDVSPRIVRSLVTKFDRNDDGRIYIQDFIDFCTDKARYERPPRRNMNDRDVRGSRNSLRSSRNSSSGRRDDLPASFERDLKDAFFDYRGDIQRACERLDRSDRGYLDLRSFEDLLRDELRMRPLTRSDMDQVMAVLDPSNDGRVDYKLFISKCKDLGMRGGDLRGSRTSMRGSYDDDRRNDRRYDGRDRRRDDDRRDDDRRYDDRRYDDRSRDHSDIDDIAERLSKRFKNMANDSRHQIHLEDVFDRFDLDRRGSVSIMEFERLLEDEISFSVTRRDMRQLTKRFDRDGNGRVDRREFLEFCEQHGYLRPPQMTSEERSDLLRKAKKRSKQVFDEARNIGQLENYKRDFAREDIDGRGKIKVNDFKRVLDRMDMRLRPKEIQAIVETYGSRGLVDYEEFLRETGGDSSRDPLRTDGHVGGRRVDLLIDEVKRVLRRAAGEGRNRDYVEIFEHMDHNDSGYISRKEFQSGITTLGVRDLSESDMINMMKRFDRNGDGKIDYREFLSLIRDENSGSGGDRFSSSGGTREFEKRLRMKLRQSNAVLRLDGGSSLDVRAAFESMDVGGKGYVTSKDFRDIATDHGWDLTREEFQFLIRKFDRNGTGSLEYADFLGFLSLDDRSINDIESRFRMFLQKKNAEGVSFCF